MNGKQRKRHIMSVFVISTTLGVIIGSLLTPYADRTALITTAALLLGVVALVAPPYSEVYDD